MKLAHSMASDMDCHKRTFGGFYCSHPFVALFGGE